MDVFVLNVWLYKPVVCRAILMRLMLTIGLACLQTSCPTVTSPYQDPGFVCVYCIQVNLMSSASGLCYSLAVEVSKQAATCATRQSESCVRFILPLRCTELLRYAGFEDCLGVHRKKILNVRTRHEVEVKVGGSSPNSRPQRSPSPNSLQ